MSERVERVDSNQKLTAVEAVANRHQSATLGTATTRNFRGDPGERLPAILLTRQERAQRRDIRGFDPQRHCTTSDTATRKARTEPRFRTYVTLGRPGQRGLEISWLYQRIVTECINTRNTAATEGANVREVGAERCDLSAAARLALGLEGRLPCMNPRECRV